VTTTDAARLLVVVPVVVGGMVLVIFLLVTVAVTHLDDERPLPDGAHHVATKPDSDVAF